MDVINTAKNKLIDSYKNNDSDGIKYYETYLEGAKAQLEEDIIKFSDKMKKLIEIDTNKNLVMSNYKVKLK